MIVALVLLAAIAGPTIAPRDPMQTNPVVEVGERFWTPPFPVFTVPGFPMGSDQFGRDLFSRLLWAIAPTLLMVIPVALVRLLVGTLLGLAAGFSTNRLGHFLELLISGALAVPVLLVALGGIAMLGVKHGLIVFIFGLALNGWAETARFIQEQTRLIKQQPYIEAAQALGGSTSDLLFRHVLRQVVPYLWMLVAFEISGTMVVAAELGSLGYYIGGGVWIEVFDFVAVNVVGLPELGQMLGTSITRLTTPNALLMTAGVIFVIILGFNLLGEGLRSHTSLNNIRPNPFWDNLRWRLDEWLDRIIPEPGSWRWRWGVAFFIADVLAVVLLSIWLIGPYVSRVFIKQPPSAPALVFSPHPWPMERHDPQGTLYTPVVGPQKPGVAWTFQDAAGFSGGPVVAQDGSLYIASQSRKLYALDAQGKLAWQVDLPEPPVGAPALGAAGEIYVVGNKGGIVAVKPDGSLLWSLPSNLGIATSGPIVAADGKIYYTIIDSVRVVSPQGELLAYWPVSKSVPETPPRLSPDEAWILLHEGGVSRVDGSKLDTRAVNDEGSTFSDPVFVVGANGEMYFRSGHGLTLWKAQDHATVNLGKISWDPKGSIMAYPADAGMSASGLAWMVYTDAYGDTRIVWINEQDLSVSQVRLAFMGSRVIGVDGKDTLYACTTSGSLTCYGIHPGKNQPSWSLDLNEDSPAAGGAVLPGRLYVSSQGGMLYALEDR